MTSGFANMRRQAHLIALEPRMMFDAAAGAVVQNAMLSPGDAAHPADAHAAVDTAFHDIHVAAPDNTSAAAARSAVAAPAAAAPHDVIFIDTSVADYQQLAREWAGKGEIVLIDSSKDGIDQMRAALAGDTNIAAIHIVSHGKEGVLFLGTTRIDEATITGGLASSLAAIGRSLNPGGDILLYGCDFAEGSDGARALAAFAQATHANAAASTDLTGYAGQGGDWVLEAHQGDIQAHALSSADWQHTLDPNVPVPIAVTPDSLTVTDGSGNKIVTGSTGYTTTNGTDRSANVGAGATARWTAAATLADGTKVDLIATVVSISNGDSVQFNRPTNGTNGNDPTFLLRDLSNGSATNGDGATVQMLWSLVISGTNTPIAANVQFGILDIDGVGGQPNTRESVSVPTTNLAYYTAERTTDIAINPSLSTVQASGTMNENTDPTKPLDTKSEVTFDWTKVSSFTINYSLAANNGVTTQAQFYQDGNADFKYTDPVYVSIPRLDLDANDSTAKGNDAHFVYTPGGADSPIVDSDVAVSNPMDINSVTGATLVLTNAQAGDALHVGTLPSGITATVTGSGGTITVALTGAASQTDYDSALRAVTFANTATNPSTTQRVIDVSFTNAKLASATAVSRIDINHAPVANPDSVTTPEEQATTIKVLANDTDADGDPLTVTSATALHGTVTINPDGSLGYTPDALYRGSDTISYAIKDGRGGTASSTVAVTVTPVNHAPQDVGTLPSQATQDAATVSYKTATGFTDPDGDTQAYSATGLPKGLSIDAATGVISGTIDHSASQVNGGAYTIAVKATDPSNASATQTFTLTVTNPPPVAVDDSASVHVNTPKTINVLANDSDPDGDPLSVTAATAAHGSVVINADNTITYTPTTGYAGTDTINYTISDGQGGTSSAIVHVTVGNAAPINAALPAQAANDAQTVSLPIAGYFSDADGDTLTYSATGLPAGLSINPATGVISGTIDRSASQVNGGVYTSVITANDGHGGTDAAPLKWTIANPAPVAVDDSASVHVNTPRTINVLANDSDPDGDPLSVTSATAAHGSVVINADNTITYTPTTGYAGSDTINYTISDGQGGTSSAVVHVTVANAAPTNTALPAQAANDAQAVSLPLASYFYDADGDTLTYSATGLPAGLSINPATGVISGTIDRSASQVNGGVYTSIVTVSDGHGGTDAAPLQWTIANPAPTARDDTATTPEEQPVTIAVLANDTDPDGDPLTVTSATAQHGTVTINPDNTITYTPDALYRGSDSIAYTISDGQGGTSSAHVAVTVTPVNHAPQDVGTLSPQASQDAAMVSYATATGFKDPDGDTLTYSAMGLPTGLSIDPATGVISGTIDRSASQVNGGTYTIAVKATDPSNASATQTFTLTVTNPPPVAHDDSATTPEEQAVTIKVLANDIDPNGDTLSVTSASAQHGSVAINADGTITYTPNALYRGADSIVYTISDGQGGTSSAHVAVTVTPVNHPPQAVAIPAAYAAQDGAVVSIPVAQAFTDPDGDTLTYAASGLPAGVAIDPATGMITGTIDRSASQVNGGVYTITLTATDPSGASAAQHVTLTVSNPPPVARDDMATTPEEQPVTIAVLANDTDPDGDPLSVTSANAQHGSVAINPDGTITYTPDALYRGSDSIAYTISDGQGGTSSAQVAVTVTPVNHASQDVGTLPSQASQDAATVSYKTATGFTDPDGDTLAYSATGLPKGLSIDAATGVISGTIDHSASQVNGGSYAIAVKATDPSNASATQTFTLTVTNPPPVAVDDNASVHVNTPKTINVLANDSDPDGDGLSVTSATAAHGSVFINADNTITYTPTTGYAGTDTINYAISDGQGGTSSAVVHVTVGNAAPTNAALPAQAANDAQAVSLPIASYFSDADGDTLTYSATGLPAGLSIDPATGVISGTIDRSASQVNGGVYTSVVTVSDGHGGTDAAPLQWTIANPPPVARDDTATTPEEQPVTIAVLANDTDPDGDPLTVTAATAQHGSVAINPDGTITYTPDALYRGTDSIAYTISDGQGGTSSAHVAITVTPVNHAPTAQPIAAQAASDSQPIALAVGGFFADPDGDTLTYSATGLPPGLSIDAATGVIAGTLNHSASQGGVYHVVVTATDPSNAKASSAFDWTIVNPAPVAANDSATTAEDTHVTIPVLANDRDPDGDPIHVVSASAQHGTVGINPDGTLDYLPGAHYRGNDVIVYTIADSDGATATASVLVTVTPVNHAPVAVAANPPAQAALEGATVAISATPLFRDVDGDTLTFAATGLPTGLAIDPATGVISGTIDHQAASRMPGGIYPITVTATDPGGLSASSTFALQVTNPPPVVADSAARTVEDTGLVLPALGNAHDPDGDTMSVTAASAQHGSVSINADGTIAYQPGPSFVGTDLVRYTVTDSDGGTATATITVTVAHVNHPPVIPAPGVPIAAVGGRPVRIDALAGVTDPDGDKPFITQASSANGVVSVAPDGTITFTPYLGFAGTTTINYVVADGNGGFTNGTYVVRVADGRSADIGQLLEIGQVRFVDPTPGFATVRVGGDGVIRNPLAIIDSVEQVRSLNATQIGSQPVGDAVEAIRTLRGTDVDPAHPITGEVSLLDALRDQRDAGDRLFDHRWGDFLVRGMTGFSVANDPRACITVESVVRDGAIYVEIRDTAGDATPPVRSVDVRCADGARPDWIKVDHRGLAIIERGADMDELHLLVRVTRADGRTTATPIVIQGATGEIELDRAPARPVHHRAAPLDATLHTRHAAARADAARIDRIFQ